MFLGYFFIPSALGGWSMYSDLRSVQESSVSARSHRTLHSSLEWQVVYYQKFRVLEAFERLAGGWKARKALFREKVSAGTRLNLVG